MLNNLQKELFALNQKSQVKSEDIRELTKWLHTTNKITRDENIKEHMCAFYVPIDTLNKKIYLIIHKKSGLWMPPGGHIDKGETSVNAVIRECKEELDFTIQTKMIKLFDLSIDPIDNPVQPCKKHFSLWYTVNTGYQKFNYNREESADGKWVTLSEAKEMVTFPTFIDPIASLSDFLDL